MKTIEQLTSEIGEAMTAINAHTGAAQERLGVGDTQRAMAEVLQISAQATIAGKANQMILDQFGAPPVAPPAYGPGNWPNPPGAPFILSDTQKVALFAAESGVGTVAAWIATMPVDTPDSVLNIYKQFYGPGAGGYPECQYWYAHR